jgi:PDZ domain
MSVWKKYLPAVAMVTVATLFTATAAAQDDDQAELDRLEQSRDAEVRMREAERQLEEAARRIAELSGEQLARAGEYETRWMFQNSRPVLGITIGSEDDAGPVEGVGVIGISPGGAADEAGIRSGDIITAINGESLSSSSGYEANQKLLEFMAGVEEGDLLDVEYLRDKKTVSVELKPRARSAQVYDFRFDRLDPHVAVAPDGPGASVFAWIGRHGGHGFGEMEMVELNKSLGRYFGTDSGLLIVRAPQDNAYQLQDGDVLKSIDGRTPENLRHAIRILSSYESGETVSLKILRDKREKTITVEVPENRRSHAMPMPAPAPAAALAPMAAPAPAVVVVPKVRIVRNAQEST